MRERAHADRPVVGRHTAELVMREERRFGAEVRGAKRRRDARRATADYYNVRHGVRLLITLQMRRFTFHVAALARIDRFRATVSSSFIAASRHARRCASHRPLVSQGPRNLGWGMVPVERIELPTFGLQNRCTTAVLHRRSVFLRSALAKP